MPREPKAGSFIIASMQVEPPSRHQTWTLINHSTAVPTSFTAAFQLKRPQFHVRITVNTKTGRPTVTQLEVTPGRLLEDGRISGGQDGVTTTNLRQLLIDRLVRTAFEAVRRPAEMAGEENRLLLLNSGFPPDQADTLNRMTFRVPGATPPGRMQIHQGPHEHRGRETPQDRITKAAELFRQATAAGSAAPVKDVGIALGYSTSQASRYLKAAREQGILDSATPQQPDAQQG